MKRLKIIFPDGIIYTGAMRVSDSINNMVVNLDHPYSIYELLIGEPVGVTSE